MNNYYVYVCYVDDVVKYVGQGKGERYKHCVSGTSSNTGLNRAHFIGSEMEVVIAFEDLSKVDSMLYEQEIIDSIGIDNLYNKSNSIKTLCKFSKNELIAIELYIKTVYDNLNSSGDAISLIVARGCLGRYDRIVIPIKISCLKTFLQWFGYEMVRYYTHYIRYMKVDFKSKPDVIFNIMKDIKLYNGVNVL
jgi:hypothetical protein